MRGEYTRTIEPARAVAEEAPNLERILSGLVNQACALTPVEIGLPWQSAPPHPRGDGASSRQGACEYLRAV